ncbi:pentapeptide repeat-containing protein [Streptomyces calvus]|nr:pentapeptide repeat-containing protein [Streptomyces calvus]MBA8974422.1 uncharacterized protein YjbI with pentapeptide repeats [Streptomyces calvus]
MGGGGGGGTAERRGPQGRHPVQRLITGHRTAPVPSRPADVPDARPHPRSTVIVPPPGTTASEAPDWPQCAHGSGADRCRGRRVDPHPACLAHLGSAERAGHLAGLRPGAALDHRGTPFTPDLLDELLAALDDPATGRRVLGPAEFDEAHFSGEAMFERVDFTGDVSFGGARFGGAHFTGSRFGGGIGFGEAEVARDAWFDDVQVDADAWFYGARIGGALRFPSARIGGSAVFNGLVAGGDVTFGAAAFDGTALFTGAEIAGEAWFDGARFADDASFDRLRTGRPALFDGALFQGEACFDLAVIGDDISFRDTEFRRGAGFSGATFGGGVALRGCGTGGDITFRGATFQRTTVLGPLALPGLLDLSDAVFQSAVTVEAAARDLRCRRTRWASTAALRLRHARVDVRDAVLEFPVSIASRSRRFVADDGREIDEPGLTDARVRVVSLSGADAAHLVLTDVDLTDCLFAETVHLDQLRLGGRCPLALPPSGIRWTRRRTLIEEHHWRAERHGGPGWTPAPPGTDVRAPAVLAPVYRQLRKALEDGRNEPGAADFYYGEMEMRRHDPETPRGERVLLGLYWAVSGYGLRATRALGWLLLAVVATVLAMTLWGLPQDDPRQTSTGRVSGGGITLTTEKPDPVNPQGPYARRLSGKRAEKALRTVVNSVVFRSSGQELTTAGTYIEMTSRVVEPALLGLAVLAVRSRVKR